MDSTLLIILTIFIALTTLAMVVQAVAMVGLARAAKEAQEKVNVVLPEVVKVMDAAQTALTQTSKFVSDASVRTTDILDATKSQLGKMDEAFKEASTRVKTQLDRAELVLDDAMNRTQHTVAAVQRGVISPIREVHGVLLGIRTAITHLGRGNRPTVDHATADEEMFI